MAQPAIISDVPSGEVVKIGSQPVAFTPLGGGAAQTLVCEEITWSKDTRAIEQFDEAGKPSKNAHIPVNGKGTMTVQIKASTTRLAAGATGFFVDTDGVTQIFFIVTACGPRFSQMDATKINISIAEKLN